MYTLCIPPVKYTNCVVPMYYTFSFFILKQKLHSSVVICTLCVYSLRTGCVFRQSPPPVKSWLTLLLRNVSSHSSQPPPPPHTGIINIIIVIIILGIMKCVNSLLAAPPSLPFLQKICWPKNLVNKHISCKTQDGRQMQLRWLQFICFYFLLLSVCCFVISYYF